MYRTLYHELTQWKSSHRRKPMMLYGARQVGKTYLLREFGRNEYDNMLYINCYRNPTVESLFAIDKDIDRILLGLSAINNTKISPGKTLIFLDEVQEIPSVVSSLKYFCEDRPDIHIVVAGSLLGVMNMAGESFPVGKVDIKHLYPMSFYEFLRGIGEDAKAEILAKCDMDMLNALSPAYEELLRQYYFVGGMPEAVASFASDKDPMAVRDIQNAILQAYEADIAKHAGRDTQRARMVYESIPGQLAKENKKFIYGAIKPGARASDFETAIQWLVDAGLVYKVNRALRPTLPLKFYEDKDAFKLFLLDVGLLGALSQSPPAQMLVGDNVFKEFKGAFTENYMLEQVVAIRDVEAYYFSKDNSTLEIDFLLQAGNSVVPVEVKAEENVRSKSMRQFVTKDNASLNLHGYRFSMKGFREQDWVTNVPLYAAGSFISGFATRQ